MVDQIIQQYSYDAYGNALNFNASQALTNLLYSGEQFNPVSGLQYLRARWYNPQSGRFNRLDPFAGNQYSPLSFHKYAYAHMNPVMHMDPSGFSIFGSLVDIATTLCIRATLFVMQHPALIAMFNKVAFGVFVGSQLYEFLAEAGLTPKNVYIAAIRDLSLLCLSVGFTTYSIGASDWTGPVGSRPAGTPRLSTQFKDISNLLDKKTCKMMTGSNASGLSMQAFPGNTASYLDYSVAGQGKLASGVQYVRVYANGVNNPNGYWLTPKSEVLNLTPQQIQNKLALPNLPTHYVDVRAVGANARVGYVRPNFSQDGGGIQVELETTNGVLYDPPIPIGSRLR